MQTLRVAHFLLTDNDSKRYSIPNNVIPNPKADATMRMEMLGFSYQLSPFSFTFKDVVNPTNVFLTTQNCSLVYMDKFIQMDFVLPSQRVYGFGERVHEF